MTDSQFGKVYDYITDRCPQLAVKNTRLIQEWLFENYDPELDIIPAINECTKYGGKTIQSYAFFHEAIKRQHEKRISAPVKSPEQTQSEKEADRAKNLRWMRDKKIVTTKYGPQDYAWLEQYEQKHGRIET